MPARPEEGMCRAATAALCTAIVIVMAAPMAACDSRSLSRQRSDAAASPAPPARTPVGPIPGAGGKHVPTTNPLAGQQASLQDGRRLFVAFNCSGCHGGHAGGGMGPSLRDEVWLYGSADAQVFDSIAAGRAHGMPAWGTRLPEQEIWKLVAYIKSMRTGAEPDPPR